MSAIPAGSTVAVTGFSGYVGSHVAEELVARGYAVRGTVRSLEKGNAVKDSILKRQPSAKIDLVTVEDFAKPGVFDSVLEGCAAAAHVATDLSFRPNPHEVVTPVVEATKNILASAKKSGTIKRFVMTSGATALLIQPSTEPRVVDGDSWNMLPAEIVWQEPYTPDKAPIVLGASKVLSEKAAWDFVRDEKPDFALSTVLPNVIFGDILNTNVWASTGGMVRTFYLDPKNAQNTGMLGMFPPSYQADVQDTAKLHVAALTEEDVKGERLLAFGDKYNFNAMIRLAKAANPSGEYPEEDPNLGEDQTIPKNERSIELLKRFGQDGFTSLAESFKKCIESK
jgi:nucleoside-diphosphate-sugar epimerase